MYLEAIHECVGILPEKLEIIGKINKRRVHALSAEKQLNLINELEI